VIDESSSTPMYNLKAVVAETGLKPDTLRAWERRYGLPEPHRTPSGHRLYSEHDIRTLKWLIGRQQAGLSISHAVSYWQRLVEDGKNPFEMEQSTQDQAQSSSIISTNIENSSLNGLTSPSIIDQLRQHWISACIAFDERQSEQILEQAFSIFSAETVCLKVLQQGIAEIGMGWLQGTITPQQEHFASSLAMRRLQTLISATPLAIKAERILIGCPPGEMHTFSSVLLTLLLRRRGWYVIYIGANVPIENILDTVGSTSPDLVVLGAQQLHTAATLREIAIPLAKADISIAFGGCIFNQNERLQEQIPGHYLGNQIEDAVRVIEQILHLSQEEQNTIYNGVIQSDKRFSNAAAVTFQKCRSQIEFDIWKKMEDTQIDKAFLIEANSSIGRTIYSILILQLEIEQLHHIDVQWLSNTLSSHYTVPSGTVSQYLFAYAQTLQKTMQNEAETAVQWLNKLGTIQKATAIF